MSDRTCRDCGADMAAQRGAQCVACRVAVMRHAGFEPLEPFPGAHKPWKCRCSVCGTIVTPHYNNVRKGATCRACSYVSRGLGFRTPEVQAVETMRAAGVEPLDPYPGNSVPWRGRCIVCRREVFPTLHNVKSGHAACAWCSEHFSHPGEALAVMRAARLEPRRPFPGATTPWESECLRCHRVVAPRYQHVRNGSGCFYCGRNVPTEGEARATMRSKGLEPLVPYPGADVPWKCRCAQCGHEVSPCYLDVRGRAAVGCRWCIPTGFKPHAEALVYLVTHEAHGAAKIGVTNVTSVRLARHAQRGWVTVATVRASGEVALAVEAAILGWWRVTLRLPIYLGPLEMPQGGWTETVAASAVNLEATVRRMRRAAAERASR